MSYVHFVASGAAPSAVENSSDQDNVQLEVGGRIGGCVTTPPPQLLAVRNKQQAARNDRIRIVVRVFPMEEISAVRTLKWHSHSWLCAVATLSSLTPSRINPPNVAPL